MQSFEFLQSYLKRKKEVNPSYSLRALARDLKLSPSFLSELLKGKKRIPEERLDRFCELLEIDSFGKMQLTQLMGEEILARRRLTPLTGIPRNSRSGSADYAPLAPKKQAFLSPWYYPALLDLATCNDFEADPKWIATRLGLRLEVADFALKRLLAAGMLVEIDGRITKAQKKLRVPTRRSRAEVRAYHSEMITRALQHLNQNTDEKSFSRRLVCGLTTAANPAKIAEARERLNLALHEVAEILSSGECTEIYQINLQLYPHTSPACDKART